MRGYVVGASIAVKWLVEEQWSTDTSSLLDGGATPIALELLFAEVVNAL